MCSGSATLDQCGICSSGSTGILPNAPMDCEGTCNGTAVINTCGICVLGKTGRLLNAGQDCAGTCNGTAKIDDCKVCTGGVSGVEFNRNKDCAGQCFGAHKPSDLACHCPTYLDACYVCGGDNSSCSGCDGVPYSGLNYDYCGVCKGTNTRCCFSSDSTVYIGLHAYHAIPSSVSVVTGQTVIFAAIDEALGYSHTIVITPTSPKVGPTRALLVTSGNEEAITFSALGVYSFYSEMHTILRGSITVYDYNRNSTNARGDCIATPLVVPPLLTTSKTTSVGGATRSYSSTMLALLHWLMTLLSGGNRV